MKSLEVESMVNQTLHLMQIKASINDQYEVIVKLRDYLKANDYPADDWKYYFSSALQKDEFTLHVIHVLSEKEIILAEEYLLKSLPSPISAHLSNTLIDDEINLLVAVNQIHSGARICFLGSGAMPTSAITLVQRGYEHITCVDYDQDALMLGDKVLRKLYPEKIFKSACVDASQYDYKDFDVVWVANFLTGKCKTLQKIKADRGGQRTIVIVRDTPGLKGIIHHPLSEDDIPADYPVDFRATEPVATRVNTSRIYTL